MKQVWRRSRLQTSRGPRVREPKEYHRRGIRATFLGRAEGILRRGGHPVATEQKPEKFNLMISSGVPNAPEYLIMVNLDDVLSAYDDTTTKTLEPRQHWVTEMMETDSELWEMFTARGPIYQYYLAEDTKNFYQQPGGVHVIQQITGCEWDDETEKMNGFTTFGYNGEDFIAFDKDSETWIALTPEAELAKQDLKTRTEEYKLFHTVTCPSILKNCLKHAESFLNRKVLPSVSLLQTTPSSPVSCHATGFYPNKAMMFWRKDGEEIHEGVVHRDMLLNQDGSFQFHIDLNISSVTPEDWRRYDCVFQLSGNKEEVVIGLKKSLISTNWGKSKMKNNEVNTTPIVVAVVVLLVLIVIGAIGFTVYKKKKEKPLTSSPETDCELSERLNSQTIQDPAHSVDTT
uniref:Ig-like domain-containing protein n=2 Tax=Oreochromis niloticus TaxID=8128 RepID=I3JML2_ORENI